MKILGFYFALFAFLTDQLHKLSQLYWFNAVEGERIVLFLFLDHVLVWNPGIACGLFPQDSVLGNCLSIGISLAVCFVIVL